MAVGTRVNMQMYSNRPPPSRVSTKPCKRVVVNENGKMGLNPNQLRPTNLPRGLQVEPAQVVSPAPDAGRSSGSRALRLSPYSYYPLLPSSKELVPVVDSFSLTAAGQPRIRTGFPSFSLKKTQRTSTSRSLWWHSKFVNSDIIAISEIDDPRRPLKSYPVHDRDSNTNHGYAYHRSFSLSVSTPKIVNFHIRDLRIPSPCNSSIKGRSPSPTTNGHKSPIKTQHYVENLPKGKEITESVKKSSRKLSTWGNFT
jgi:hypothetical protein